MNNKNTESSQQDRPSDIPLELKEYELKLKEQELEIKYAQLGLKEKESELAIKEKEMELRKKEEEFGKRGSFKEKLLNLSAVGATIIVGIIGALGALGGNWYQGQKNIELERQKFESALILKAVEPEDTETKRRNLLFFLESGLIKDTDTKIQNLANQPGSLPDLPKPEPQSTSGGNWIVVIESDDTLDAAKEHAKVAANAGYNDIQFYKRNNIFRTTIKFSSKEKADSNLASIKSKINPTAYSVNPETWCLGPTPTNEYIECKGQ